MSFDPIATIRALFARSGAQIYGEAVTQLDHALQCAAAAEAMQAGPALVTAALLHDVGHLLHDNAAQALAEQRDDRHEALGAAWLRQWFPNEVTRPIALHVEAKRCLVQVDPTYWQELSEVSRTTLELQGGRMHQAEAEAFLARAFAAEAVQLRRCDELGKVAGAGTLSLEHFLTIAAGCLRR